MKTKTYAVNIKDIHGMALRLCMLQTHYRKPKDWRGADFELAHKTLLRWWKVCIPCSDGPPLTILEALCDDLNTPQVIAIMHGFSKTDGRALFASMKLIGLIPGHGKLIDYDLVDGIKTIPEEHLSVGQWVGFSHEFSTIGNA